MTICPLLDERHQVLAVHLPRGETVTVRPAHPQDGERIQAYIRTRRTLTKRIALVRMQPASWVGVALSGIIGREKLGIDPTLKAVAIDLNPVPLPVCSCEACAFGGGPKNRPASGWRRPDVYPGTL
jgi:hypothetical protein